MISALLIGYVLLSVGIVIAALRHRAGYLHYPFWVALTFGGFAVPQVISLARAGGYPGYSLEKYVIMAVFCLLATCVGFTWGRRAALGLGCRKFFFRSMDPSKLRWLSLFYIIIGGFFLTRLYSSGAEFTAQGWEGPIVIYLFFSAFMVYGFIIAADLYLQKGHKVDIALAIVGGAYLLLRTAVHGRRSSAVLLFVIVLGLLWFRRRTLVPVPLIIAAVAGGLVASASMNAYRTAVADKLEFSRLADIDFIGTFRESYGAGGAYEVLNGCYVIETTDRTLAFDFGIFNWNAAVAVCVPRQLVGEKFKQSLMLPWDVEQTTCRIFGYAKERGTTLTGIADCYLTLSYAGCIKFLLIAFVLGLLYAYAEHGSTAAIVIYLLLLPRGLVAFTHGTAEFSDGLIICGLCMTPGLLLSSFGRRPALQVVSNGRNGIRG